MSYLLDTNVVSETIRCNPSKAVISWLDQIPAEAFFISVLTLGEIRKGIEALSDRKHRKKLRLWIDHELPRWFDERVVPVDLAVADRWGRLLAEIGRSVPTINSLLAATALHHDLRLVTHHVRDFDYPGLEVINPWLSLT
jgi:predicted nucleic acid-binding protein